MDAIWNLTRACPWDCEICCVSDLHVCSTTKYFVQRTQKDEGKELVLPEKLTVLKSLADKDFEIDFSGGDPLYYDEDFQVVEQATRWLPSEKISVSMTGSGINEIKLELLRKVGAVEFTLDNLPGTENPYRPRGYNLASMMAMKKCVSVGVKVRAITVLSSSTISRKNLKDVYWWLCENRILEWELLRFYPVGRGANFIEFVPPNSDYLKTMEFLRGLHGFTKIFFQHSLRILEGNLRCSAGIDSIGILPDGQITACAWAIDNNCCPFKDFYLGKLPEDDLDEVLDRVREFSGYSKRTSFCRTIACIEKNK